MAHFAKLATANGGVVVVNSAQVVALEPFGEEGTTTVIRTTASTESGAAKRYIVEGSVDAVWAALRTD